ncbi:ATP-binding protein [Bacillus rubiinfantis]|uniref:ATP-binding protein n=1 Tax=Bacillus rubiinfantis TaxID=1499680 RepID=UPI0005A8FA0F|nr:transporter substrate-binding domain-containing protein [Bacillus rubiinfantis]
MKKDLLIYIGLAVCFLMLFANSIILKDYQINLFQYIKYSQDFSLEEKQWIVENSPIIYGADESSPPLRFVDNETKQFKGVVIDYLNSLSLQLGGEIKFVPFVWSEALKQLEDGHTDLADMFISKERSEKYIYSIPIYKLKGSFIQDKAAKPIKDLNDLNGKRITLAKGDYAQDFLQEKQLDVKFIYVHNVFEGIQAVDNGLADVLVGDEPVLAYYLDQFPHNDSLHLSNIPLYEENVVLATTKKNKQLIQVMNKGILHLEKSNAVDKIQEKWTGLTAPVKSTKGLSRPSFIITVFITVFLLIIHALATIIKSLKDEVIKRNRELYQSKMDLEYVFQSIPEMMLIVDKNYRIIQANNLLLHYVGKPLHSFQGQSLFYDCEELAFLRATKGIFDEVLETGNLGEMDLEHQEHIYHVSCYPMKYMLEDKKNVILSIKDTTFQRLNEQQLLQVNKMAAIGELAAGVAHEIRNPLGIIRSYIYYIKNYHHQNFDEDQYQKAISAIERSIDRAKKIIDHLLNFSRLSSDREEKIILRDFIEELLFLEEKRLKQLNIEFYVDCPCDLSIFARTESLKHILVNLINNAIDAMEQGGTLRISCRQTGKYLSIKVKDTGVGISEDIIDSIFNPFFTTKPPNQGTGLGLYITFNEVQKLGGRITVKSTPNVGTEFEIKL